jgi:sRNA-binding regulator protein Hfq
MANSFHIPADGMPEPCPDFSLEHADGRLRKATPGTMLDETSSTPIPATLVTNSNQIGPRKLVRPKLPARAFKDRTFAWRTESPMLSHQAPAMAQHYGSESSNAEAFYFQKQVQTQTLMVFVLEDGEQIEGYIEWYDRNAIKVRNGSRTLIYKSAIKYLYKAGDVNTSLDGIRKAR